jgi:hypothetical protein
MAVKINPLIYARFVDDTYIQVLSENDQAENTITSITKALNSMDPCLAYTVESTITFLAGKSKKKKGKATPFLVTLSFKTFTLLASTSTLAATHWQDQECGRVRCSGFLLSISESLQGLPVP